MRPDEHKKKRSAQYKKKHGMAQKDKELDRKTDKKQQRDATKSEGPVESNKKHEPRQEAKGDSSEDSSSKLFRRRQIERNWSRYEDSLSADEDVPEQRGDDFQKLLSAAGGSLAQFRLKDEEDWVEEDLRLQSSDSGGFLNIDFEEISSALACLPVHGRLGLSQDLFSETQLSEMRSLAQLNSAEYDRTADPDIVNKETDINLCRESDLKSTKKEQSEHEEEKITFTGKIIHIRDNDRSKDTESGDVSVDVKSVSKTNSKVKTEKPEVDTKSLEDDLDFLLSLDKPDPEPPVKSVSVNSQVKTVVSSPDTKDVPKKQHQAAVQSKPAGGGASDDLDWLDSMLDG